MGNCDGGKVEIGGSMKAETTRRLYLREGATTLVAVRLAMRFVPSAWILAWAGRPPRRVRRFAGHEVGWVTWAIETLGDKPSWKGLSLPRALAAHWMLRRRGILSRLCLGVAEDGEALATYAWVEVGGDVVVGGAETTRFKRLAAYGGERA
jgi:Transglutaminase-like superfamily